MRGTSVRVQTLPKATTLVYAMLVSMFAIAMLPHVSRAEESPVNLSPEKTVGVVESPGAVRATSPANSYELVWAWDLPAGGLTPDYTPEEPGERDTDIVQYGFELLADGISVETGVVASDVLTVATPVISGGEYTLKVWSITRAGETSATASAGTTIAKAETGGPVLPPIKEDIIPKPIDPVPSIAESESKDKEANGPVYYVGGTERSEQAHSSVLSATNEKIATQAETAAVVKPSSQGWMILGMAWYVWIIIIVAMLAAGRGIMAYFAHR